MSTFLNALQGSALVVALALVPMALVGSLRFHPPRGLKRVELVSALAGRRSFLRSRDQTKLRQKLCGGPKRSKPPKSLVSLNPGEGYAGVAKGLADHLGVARAKFEALTVGRDHMRSDQSDLVTKTRQRSPPSMRRSARFQADHTPR